MEGCARTRLQGVSEQDEDAADCGLVNPCCPPLPFLLLCHIYSTDFLFLYLRVHYCTYEVITGECCHKLNNRSILISI